jgi:hypothetical protein
MDPCRNSIERFLQRQIGRWRGLPRGCKAEEIANWLSFNDGAGRALYGADRVEYEFRSLTYAGFTSGVFFYFSRGDLEFISTEYWSFDAAECAAVLGELGNPESKLDFFWKTDKIESGEWVYAARGISVAVVPATQLIAMVTAFPPCAPDVYSARYRSTALAREFRGDN